MTMAAPKNVRGSATKGQPRRQAKPSPRPRVSRGHKLLCIDDRGFQRHYVPGPPIRGHVYCVREVYEDGGQTGVLLVGIAGPVPPNGLEQGFLLSRFRWVHE